MVTTTLKQLEANKRNSSLSTGPKSIEGKSLVKMNPVKHGLTSVNTVLADEDPKQYSQLRIKLNNDLKPFGAMEEKLVDIIASKIWRLNRVLRIETELFEKSGKSFSGQYMGMAQGFRKEASGADSFLKICRYERSIERGLYQALSVLKTLQNNRGLES